MTEMCPRCESNLPLLDGAAPAFCSNCGLPQLRIAEGIGAPQTQTDDALTGLLRGHAGQAVNWKLILRQVVAFCLLGALPCTLLFSLLFGGAGLFLVLLLLVPACVLWYEHKSPLREISAGVGARIGATFGLFVASMVSVGTGVAGFVLRYGYHQRILEESLNQVLRQVQEQMQTQAAAMQDGAAAASLLNAFQWPEMRAGAFLFGEFMSSMFLLGMGCVVGALAGALLAQRRRRLPR